MFCEICFYFIIIHLTYMTVLFVFNCFNKLVVRISLEGLKLASTSIKS